MEEEYTYTADEHAYIVLHAAYPYAPLAVLTDAVMTDWVNDNTDEQNIENCSYLEEYDR